MNYFHPRLEWVLWTCKFVNLFVFEIFPQLELKAHSASIPYTQKLNVCQPCNQRRELKQPTNERTNEQEKSKQPASIAYISLEKLKMMDLIYRKIFVYLKYKLLLVLCRCWSLCIYLAWMPWFCCTVMWFNFVCESKLLKDLINYWESL